MSNSCPLGVLAVAEDLTGADLAAAVLVEVAGALAAMAEAPEAVAVLAVALVAVAVLAMEEVAVEEVAVALAVAVVERQVYSFKQYFSQNPTFSTFILEVGEVLDFSTTILLLSEDLLLFNYFFFPKSHFLPCHFSQIGEVLDYFLVTDLLFSHRFFTFFHRFFTFFHRFYFLVTDFKKVAFWKKNSDF